MRMCKNPGYKEGTQGGIILPDSYCRPAVVGKVVLDVIHKIKDGVGCDWTGEGLSQGLTGHQLEHRPNVVILKVFISF